MIVCTDDEGVALQSAEELAPEPDATGFFLRILVYAGPTTSAGWRGVTMIGGVMLRRRRRAAVSRQDGDLKGGARGVFCGSSRAAKAWKGADQPAICLVIS